MIRGKRRALVAVGNSILTIAHRLLSGPAAWTVSDLGSDWHDRIAPLLSSDFNPELDRGEEFAAVRMGPLRGCWLELSRQRGHAVPPPPVRSGGQR
jgi:hypothetical protein